MDKGSAVFLFAFPYYKNKKIIKFLENFFVNFCLTEAGVGYI